MKNIQADLLKKVEGHLDELKGTLLKVTDHHFQGNMEILKGKAINKQADVDLKLHQLNKMISQHVQEAKKKVQREFKHNVTNKKITIKVS